MSISLLGYSGEPRLNLGIKKELLVSSGRKYLALWDDRNKSVSDIHHRDAHKSKVG